MLGIFTLIQFLIVNLPGAIAIICFEHIQPLVNVFEQLSKLMNVNGASFLCVEHSWKEEIFAID